MCFNLLIKLLGVSQNPYKTILLWHGDMLISFPTFSRGRIVTKEKTARDIPPNQRRLLHPSTP